jgi:glutathione S-transferase
LFQRLKALKLQGMSALRLYSFPLSGHSHRAQLFASLLGLPIELVFVDLAKRAQKEPDYLALNRFGQVPVLEDGDFALGDSNAILVYLAERYDTEHRYWPTNAQRRGQIQRWLSVAAGQLFNRPLDYGAAQRKAHELFTVLEAELAERSFLVGDSATLADVAMYTYTAHAPEGDVSLEPYPALRAWLSRIEALPGFVPMQQAPGKS